MGGRGVRVVSGRGFVWPLEVGGAGTSLPSRTTRRSKWELVDRVRIRRELWGESTTEEAVRKVSPGDRTGGNTRSGAKH